MNRDAQPLSLEGPGPLTGSQLNHYIFQSRIGSAGGIDVYCALDTKLNREVAIKVLPQLLPGRQRNVEQLYREAQVQASLNHAGIAAIYGIEEDDSTTGLVMELVGGESLARRISQGPQPFEVTLEFARQIAEALEAGHERGVVHGDLKADNIMVAPDGRLRILNFGIARILAAAVQERDPAAEKRDDIRAWALVVCELLMGRAIESGRPDWRHIRKLCPKSFLELLRRAADVDHPRTLTHISLARYEIDAIRSTANNVREGRAWRRTAVIATTVSAVLAFLFLRHQESAPPSVPIETAATPAALTPPVPPVPTAPPQSQSPVESSDIPDVRVSVDFDYAGGIANALGRPMVGDDGPATAARMQPSCVVVDAEGNLYIPEVGATASRVRKVENGIITTVAGIGVAGFSGDGGPAVAAQLANPQGVAVDKAGNLYIADFGNMRIRKVTPKGTITTIAGTGQSGYNGDEIPATSANLYPPQGVAVDKNGAVYFAEFDAVNSARIRKITADGLIHTIAGGETAGFAGDYGPAITATLKAPHGVAVDDSGAVYFADYGNLRVRKIDPTGVIQTVAGTGSRGFNGDGPGLLTAISPVGVAVDRSGNVYIAELSLIRRLSPNGTITTFAGNGLRGSDGDGGRALQAAIGNLRCITVDASGDLYIADGAGGRIRKISGGMISTVAGGGIPGQRSSYTAFINPSVYRVNSGVKAPRAIQQVTPSYTKAAQAANAEGRVILEAIIRQNGAVEITRVAQGLGYGLDESAASALRQWQFAPGRIVRTDQPVDVTMNIVVTFDPQQTQK